MNRIKMTNFKFQGSNPKFQTSDFNVQGSILRRWSMLLGLMLLPGLLLAQGPAPTGKPPTPSTSVNQTHNCGNSVLSAASDAPVGVNWYWQTSSSGTSTSNGASNHGNYTVYSSGTYYIRAHNGPSNLWSDYSLSVNVSAANFKAKPSTPAAVSVANNCGSSVLTRANPPSGITWYWQSSSAGTSTANSSSSVTRTSGSTYYLRARHNSSGCWSDNSRSVSYSIQATAPTPNASVTKTYSPGSTMMTRNNPADPLHEWYWQLSSSGTATGGAYSGLTYTRTSGTTIYLRARHKLSGCWSNAQSIGYAVYNNPGTPPAPTVTQNCETTVLTRSTPPSGETWYWQDDPNATNTNNSASTITLTPTTELLNDGKHYLRARNNTLNFWSTARTINYTVNRAPSTPATVSVANNCGSSVLTRANPPSGITWYWQSSMGGMSTANSSSSVTRTSGSTYYLRARNNSTGCWSDNSRSVSYLIQTIPPTPNASVSKTYSPGSTMMTRNDPADPLHEWFWQLSSDGTETGGAYSGLTYTRTSGTTIYLRTRHKLSGCWSTNAQSIGYAIYNNPATPPAPTITYNCETTVLTRVSPPSGEIWYWQDDPNGMNTNNSASTITLTPTTELLNNGEHYLRARNPTLNFWSTARTINYTVYTTPAPPSASSVNACSGEDVQLSATSSGNTLEWFDAATGGTSLGTGTTLNLINVTADETVYVESKNQECTSTRTAVTIDVPDISYRAVQYQVTSPAGQCGDITIANTDPLGATYAYYFLGATQSTASAEPFTTHLITATGTYYFAQYNGSCYGEPVGVHFTVTPGPVEPTAGISPNVCGSRTLTVQNISGQSLSFPYASPTYLGLNGQGEHEYQLDVSGNYTVRVTKTAGCTDHLDVSEYSGQDFTDIKVTLDPNEYTIRGGGFLTDNPSSYTQVHLRESELGVTYKIFDSGNNEVGTIPGGGNKKSDPLPDGTYTVQAHRVRSDDSSQSCMIAQQGTVYVVEASTQFVDRSFTGAKAYKVPRTEAQLGTVTTADINESITYYDDKGRPVQSIASDASPDGRDLVQHLTYDALGRQQKSYLPYAADYNRVYHTSGTAANDQAGFYTTEPGVVHDSKPYSEVSFDGSPMNRVTAATGPGNAWHTGNKSASAQVLTNATADNVRRWKITNDTLVNDTYYTAGELRKQENTNEDGNKQIAFINKEGQVVLTKVQAPGNGWTETYHVYDEFGRLRYTLPPLAIEAYDAPGFGNPEPPYGFHLVETNTNFADVKTVSEGKIAYKKGVTFYVNKGDIVEKGAIIQSFDPTPQQNQPDAYYLDDLIFRYEYDHRHRLIAKKVPGADWEYIVYDERDRIVLTQTGNQRETGQWSFIKYDQWNRPVLTGLKTISGTTDTVRTAVANSTTFHESFDSQGVGQYTDNSYPTEVTIDNIQTVSYYDDYSFTSEGFSLPTGIFDATGNQILPAQSTFGVHGLTTGSWAKISGTTDQFVKTVSFYDEKYRLTQTVTQNHKSGTDRMTAQYNWQGQLTKTYVQHGTHTIEQTYTYDHMGRPLTTTHKLNSGPVKTIASYSYNALGQLENKTLADGYEDVGYRYNIRSQLTKINDPNDAESHLFEMAFKYENATNAKYDGTIGAVDWKNPFETTVNSFDYTYDEQNRLKTADFSHTGTHTRDYGLESITYDANSNITALKRKGDHDDTGNQSFDDLTYAYNGNQLMEVTDASGAATGFDDQANDKLEYSYDANGNLTADQNKGITGITYNHLNQPLTVSFEDGRSVGYTYAGAQKLSQTVTENSSTKTTDYVGGFLYENDELQLIAHDQGRVVYDGSDFEYQYYLTDHLGNIRVTFKTEIDVDEYEATMETENNAAESPYFYNLDTRHTHAGANHTSGGDEVARLDSLHLIGPAISLSVIPGDTIDMEVYAYYEGGTGYNNTVTVGSFIVALAQSFGGASGAGGESGLIFDGVDEALTAGMGGVGGSGNDAVPAAYLSYILFDQNYKAIQHGYQEISSHANLAQERLFLDDIVISEPGYLYIYTSMQSNTALPVFFDDLKVTHTHSPVIQKSDYLPFGLEMQSYTRPAITAQNFKFNSGSEANETTGWYQTPFRNYDPALGRFHGVDKLASMYSSWTPSQFAGNDPINFNDPTGLHQDDPDGEDSSPGSGNGGRGWGFRNSIFYNYWSKGIGNSDWSLWGGSDRYRKERAHSEATNGYAKGNTFYQGDGKAIDTDANGNLRVWNELGGEEITREEWLRRGGNPNQSANSYATGAWESVNPNGPSKMDLVNTGMSFATDDLAKQGFWIGRTSKGAYRLYAPTFRGSQYVTRTGLINKLGAVGFTITLAQETNALYSNPDHKSRFFLNMSMAYLSLAAPEVGIYILIAQNGEGIVYTMNQVEQQFWSSDFGQELIEGHEIMSDPRNWVNKTLPPEF